RDEGDNRHHQGRQASDEKADLHLQLHRRAGGAQAHPLVNRRVEARAFDNHLVENPRRQDEGNGHAEDGHPVRTGATDLPAEEAGDDRARQRSERNGQQKRGRERRHVRTAAVGRKETGRPARAAPASEACVRTAMAQPLSESSSSTAIVERDRNRTTRIARPIADSAAATVRMKKTKTWPAMSPRKREKAMKLKFAASSSSSTHISSRITFLRFRKMPATARANSTPESVSICPRVIMGASPHPS